MGRSIGRALLALLTVGWELAAITAASDAGVAFLEIALLRRIRVVGDYGMFDRREAPQYYPDVRG